MSTAWEFYCVDCDAKDSAPECGNACGYRYWEVRAMMNRRTLVESLPDDMDFWRAMGLPPWEPTAVDFIKEHKGHRLRIRDEYGTFECEKPEGRGPAQWCIKDDGHEGECNFI